MEVKNMSDNEQVLPKAVQFEKYAFPHTLVQPQNFGLDGIILVVCIYVALLDHIG